MSQSAKFDGTGGQPSLFVKGAFEEIPVFKLFSCSIMGDVMTLACVTGEPIQGAGLEVRVCLRRCGGFGGLDG